MKLNTLIYTGTVVFQVLVGFLLLSMAILFVHCGANVLIASQAMHSLIHVSRRSLTCTIAATNVDHADTYPAGTVVISSHSDGTVVLAQIQDVFLCAARSLKFPRGGITLEGCGGIIMGD